MLHPVGSQPPSVYWRRRLIFMASTIVLIGLILLTIRTALSTDARPVGAGTTATTPQTARHSSGAPHSSAHTATGGRTALSGARASTGVGSSTASTPTISTSSSGSGPGGSGSSGSGSGASGSGASGSNSSSAAPAPCTPGQLQVAAYTASSVFSVGDQPTLSIQVTDTANAPCVQDLADRQVVLRIYNGESRVWGSHDCTIVPGAKQRVLTPGAPVLVSVAWSGLSSQPNCAGTRQRVGPGTYTLYASLSGHEGRAVQFVLK